MIANATRSPALNSPLVVGASPLITEALTVWTAFTLPSDLQNEIKLPYIESSKNFNYNCMYPDHIGELK